jgi:hypothetical protein
MLMFLTRSISACNAPAALALRRGLGKARVLCFMVGKLVPRAIAARRIDGCYLEFHNRVNAFWGSAVDGPKLWREDAGAVLLEHPAQRFVVLWIGFGALILSGPQQVRKSMVKAIANPTPCGRGPGLAADGHGYCFTPEADGGTVNAEDAAVFPLGERGGLGVGIGVAGRGVVGEVDEAFAVAAIHFQAQDIQPFAVEFPRELNQVGTSCACP